MSLDLIEKEILRFLADSEPEVLCIRGKWGVGKTYTWDSLLDKATHNNAVALKKYAYVTLFGLNSLEDLRFSIFENTNSGAELTQAATIESFSSMIQQAADAGRRSRNLIELTASVFNRKGVTDALAKVGFLNVRKQLICIDDLERAGKGLEVRDVLGLISFLRVKRDCKIVLLLNDEQIGEGKAEFWKQVEKVADTILHFELNPSEASSIAFGTHQSEIRTIVEPLLHTLSITNIRIIKKIQLGAAHLTDILPGQDEDVVKQALTAFVLSKWAVLDPDNAPPTAYIRSYNEFASALKASDGKEAPVDKFADLLASYPYNSTDELDDVIIAGAEAGYFNETLLNQRAVLISARKKKTEGGEEFSRVWKDMYHGSLATSDEDFLDALFKSAVQEAALITPLNINSSIKLLREFGRTEMADKLIEAYIHAKSDENLEFFDLRHHHFSADEAVDDNLRTAFQEKFDSFVDDRKPLDVLKSIAQRQGWSEADIALLAKQTPSDFETMFEALQGNEVRWGIESVGSIGNSGKPGAEAIRKASIEALRRIARKSPIRARKIARFGISLDGAIATSEPDGI
ncbi:hypothetical protein [Rhizobium leguminosarum]|uniref:hypothetical protein n=1 Tax=Rhizobium leguminosarum TaxID=384 RepID=UPI0003760671|nr:hypothetical protein [Rhizobium leguminosarum]